MVATRRKGNDISLRIFEAMNLPAPVAMRFSVGLRKDRAYAGAWTHTYVETL